MFNPTNPMAVNSANLPNAQTQSIQKQTLSNSQLASNQTKFINQAGMSNSSSTAQPTAVQSDYLKDGNGMMTSAMSNEAIVKKEPFDYPDTKNMTNTVRS